MTDRFQAMQTFVAICDQRGFAAAAKRLGVSPPTVTRQLAELESRLGVRLIQRTTRAMSLTEAGARYLERTRRVIADLEDAEASAQDERGAPAGLLVVAAPDLFGRFHVAPLVSRYLALYPDAAAELRLGNRLANLVEEGIDLAIRVGALPDSSLVARTLGRTRQMVVASPAYLAAHGTPATPEELGAHQLVTFRGIVPRRAWRFRDGPTELSLSVEPRFHCDSGDVALAHALAGGGLLAALDYQVAEAIAQGRLVEILRPFAPPSVAIQALFPTARLLSRKVRAFLELFDEAARDWRFSTE